jgi:hypothetical protein
MQLRLNYEVLVDHRSWTTPVDHHAPRSLVVEVAHHHLLSMAAVLTDCSPCAATISTDEVQMKFQAAARNLQLKTPQLQPLEAQSFRVPHIVILSDICQFDRPTACPQRPPDLASRCLTHVGQGRAGVQRLYPVFNSQFTIFPSIMLRASRHLRAGRKVGR